MTLEMVDTVDYVVIGCSLIFCVVIGLVSSWRQGKKKVADKVDEYLLANRSISMLPAAFSIMATIFSSNSIAGNIGEFYMYGISNSIYFIGATVVKVFAAYYIIPVFHNLPYVSIYEYLEKRFDRTLRTTFAVLYIVANDLKIYNFTIGTFVIQWLFSLMTTFMYVFLSAVLYGPAISLATVTPIPYWANAVLLGGVCTLYCVLGGLKAVVWTDVFQSILMFACVIMVAIQGFIVAGQSEGFESSARRMANSFMLKESPETRYTVWGIFISSLLATFKSTIAGQAGAQRLLAVKDHHVARRSVYVSCAMMVLFDMITLVCAFAVYIIFSGCDPIQRKTETGVENADQMFIYAVARLVGRIPGLRGLALAGLISASLSTCSSYLNSFATIVLQDFFKVFFPKLTLKESNNIKICKILTLIFGVLTVLISFAVPYMGGIIKVSKGVSSAVLGPLAGIMVIAFFLPKVNAMASKISLLVGIALTVWVTIGNLLNPVKYHTLPLSTDLCTSPDIMNLTAKNSSEWINAWTDTEVETTGIPTTSKSHIFPLYTISFVWFGPIGMSLTCILAIVISPFIGKTDPPDECLLSPLVLKKNPKKDNVDHLAMSGIKSRPKGLKADQSSPEDKNNVRCASSDQSSEKTLLE